MKTVELELEELYFQKQKLEEKIEELENFLKNQKSKDKKEFSKDEKIELFRELFISRTDIYAKKWKSKDGTKEGFSPVSKTFMGDDFLPLTNKDLEEHLRGNIFLASYLIDKKQECKYVVLELNSEDVFKLQRALLELNISASYSLSSYNSIFAWIFFKEKISSNISFSFLYFLQKKANISVKLYPNSEFSTQEKLGSYIELPLQLFYRNKNRTVFLDINTKKVFHDQWNYLANIKKASKEQIYSFAQVLKPQNIQRDLKTVDFPQNSIDIVLDSGINFPIQSLSKSFISKLKSFASFENPQIKLLLSLRKPLYNTPKYLKGYEESSEFLTLPRGLKEKLFEYLNYNLVKYKIIDNRVFEKIETKRILFTLRAEQEDAIKEILKYDSSICVAPPGFGKTLIGAKIFEQRAVKTLIIVNKNMLLDQWISRFVDYFGYKKSDIGFLGKSQNRLNGNIDIATMQSLNNIPELVENYTQVIVDECHHIPALTFEQIVKNFKGKYILGLSATPNRKDELDPILYQQLGNISYEYKKPKTHTNRLLVIKTEFTSSADNYAAIINELVSNEDRNRQIVKTIKENIDRKILLLSDRIEHLNLLENILKEEKIDFVSVHGSQNKKEQVENMQKVKTSSLILATSSFFGEGIDFPHLNTIIFATPISFYGRLIQYLGRIGRGNQECLAIDFLDSKNAMLNSTYKKRLEGYKAMHYK
ncbi:DEAD/DEAH box helicase [Aliarcobacter cryaerophilus]|jgi:superfamily II DNA or RNA helicase|uniref:DEAD/DEAH box helicase n=1 Tax=Aliarcobacter cryaerophilus TaxID=28198 RepID=UPI0009C91123|nr:DEAD/DEAH box helicase [Aliarcobacter cryaerophilus]OQA75347.1 MAG: ATP-dependent RNA helicase SrmB [Candidatus Dependentiae bacterium ADurb.Bin246]MCT7465301.1 DEAD/DEAH box helicase [Aliarcobacter cryaerophilus]MCT7472915.1 DEAD/DEAH box helicase [Aliarcobacter cryaerophilus]MCT7486518.1 DEAD/DEAH box helicase [Aliarcobacter cryaerophilus]MCT7490923.1 DEAD/DEAH box helicase [Aliarcobacter cryaerophilus]